jgi:flagellar basal body P-ring protein FlgI
MRRILPKHPWGRGAQVAIVVLALLQMGLSPGKKKGNKPLPPKTQETVGDLAFVVSHTQMKVEGVGLVVGLENTGADPPLSWYRKQLVDEMSKAGVEKADRLLASKQVSMVLVRLTIPMGVGPKDRLDVQVEVPPGCGTKSLAGGYLLPTRLREVLVAGGTPKTGPEVATAQGPVMIGTPAKPTDAKVGRVLGGGRVKKEIPYTLAIKGNRKSFHTSQLLENVINERFHQTEDGHQKGVATAKTDSYLVLKVPALYHQNQDHFFRVVQLLPVIDTAELQTRRLATWGKDLLSPATAGVGAMKLEGMGSAAVETLQKGLTSTNLQVRFFSAEALAYLNDTSGVQVLGNTIIQNPDFRPYALAALAALDQPASHLKLRKLMDESEIPVRYGAFNALRTLDPNDSFLGRVQVLEETKQDDEEVDSPDAMAIAIVSAANRHRLKQEDPFFLYIVDSEGPSLVHVSRSRRSEIVIFGSRQKLLPPIVLGGAGPILLNAAQNDDRIELSKIVPSRFGDADTKVTTSLELGEVIRRMANLGATYPEIVSILEAASQQLNLPGQLVVDAVPRTSPKYLEAVLGADATAKHDDDVKKASTDSSKPKRRRWLGFLDRMIPGSRDENPPASQSKDASASTDSKNSPDVTPDLAQVPAGTTSSSANNDAKKSNNDTDSTAAKRDDSLQKAGLDDSSSRWRFFDFFRRTDEP